MGLVKLLQYRKKIKVINGICLMGHFKKLTSIHDIHKAQNFSSFNEDYQ